MHRLLVIHRHGSRIERFQQVTPLLLADQSNAIKPRVLMSRQRFNDLHEVVQIPLRRRFVEQRRGVVQRADQGFALLAQAQRQVELGHLTDLFDRRHHQTAKRYGNVLTRHPVQRGLEQWSMGQAACRANHFHDLLERQVLMVLRLKYTRLDLRQQRFTARTARGVDAHGQGVDEQADQIFQFGTTASRHRAADHHFGLTGETCERRGPGGHQCHVQRDALALRQFAQIGRKPCIQLQREAGACKVLLRRTRTVGRQGEQCRRAFQHLAPVGGLVLQTLTGQPATLPHSIIGVLDRQRWQRVRLFLTERRVQREQFLCQYAHRPAIGDDVVHGQQQYMTLIGDLQQMGADQRAVGQVERGDCLGTQTRLQAQGSVTNVFDQQPGVGGRGHEQHLRTVAAGHESAAQGFVAFDDTRQGSRQCRDVKRAFKAQRHRDVIGLVAAVHLCQEPQPLLSEGQWHWLVALHRQNRRQFAAGHARQRGRHSGQLTEGKQLTQRQFHAQLLANLRHHAHGQQRMPAQIEEMVVTADSLDLQHLGPDLGQCHFELAFRRFVIHPEQCRTLRFGQRTTIQFAIGCQGQHLQLDECRRHHVVRQAGLQMRAHLFRGKQRVFFMAGVIGHEPHVARFVLASQYHGFANAWQLVQTADDLTQLDTEATNLDLIVVASQAFQLTVFHPATEVAGAVHHGAWLIAERVDKEFLDAQLRTIQVAQRNAVATDVQLARHPLGRQTLMSIQHINTRIADRTANRNALVALANRTHFAYSGKRGGFGRPVAIEQAQALRLAQQRPIAGRVCAFAARKQQPQALQGLRNLLHVLVEQRRGNEQHADSGIDQQGAEANRINQRFMVNHTQLPAIEQGAPHFHGAGIERRVGRKGDAVMFVEIGIAIVQHQAGDTAMRHTHPFGCTG